MTDIRPPMGNSSVRSREEAPTPGSAWRLLFFIVFVFGVFVVSYFGLRFGYKNFLEARITAIDDQISVLAASDPTGGKQDEFLSFQFQLVNLKAILDDRTSVSKLFTLLESRTNTRVQYTDLSFDVTDMRVELQGVADSYDVLAEQLQAYSSIQEVDRYDVTDARLREGGTVSFTATLFLAPISFNL